MGEHRSGDHPRTANSLTAMYGDVPAGFERICDFVK